MLYLGSVRIGSLSSPKCGDDVDKSPVVLHPSLGSASLLFLLLLLLNLVYTTNHGDITIQHANQNFRIATVAKRFCYLPK